MRIDAGDVHIYGGLALMAASGYWLGWGIPLGVVGACLFYLGVFRLNA